ncbi:hypothetical protein RJ639_034575 [Escallonia herrerae]|uniref:Retrovirus-related Pol polyprotein from transposon RE1 n=1 Tax=Escallonia herrerae TaxID=1293975 RepID=A0AA88WVZ1_9ASTE|nr:hypothetical protein RJ639_034575 [Escallonia herrerae]
MTGAWRSLDSSEATSSTLGGTLRPTMAYGGDHLSQLSFQLTSHKLTGKNYLEWAQSVKLAIDSGGKLGHLTGDVRQPAAGNPSLSVWQSKNSLIIAWLINSMEPTIGKPYLFCPTAKDVWEAMHETYSDVENSSQISDLKTKLWKSKQGEREVTVYHNEMETCWKIHGKPPNWKKKHGSDNRVFQVSNEGNQGQQSTQEASPFTKERLEHLYTLFQSQHFQVIPSCSLAQKGNKKIKIADGSLSAIAGTGSLGLSPSITLHNVLHVPKLSCNLLSISKLTNDLKCQANFYSSRCEFQEMVSGRLIRSARASGGLYFFEDGTNSGKHVQSTCLESVFDSNDVMLWHYRLGHPRFYYLKHIHSTDEKIAILIVYVDDIILTGDDIAEMEWLKQCLASEFEIKDLGSLKFFLGMEIARLRKGIEVSQRKYVLDLLKETDMSGCRPIETPIDSNQKLGDNKGDPVNTSRYQKLVGKLIYLSRTRPDIAFAVSLVSQFMHSPHEEHLEAVYRILRYLKSSPGK